LLSLERVQDGMARVLRGGCDPELVAAIADDGIGAVARLRIYQNHMAITLTEALKANFPVVCRLVDERFFAYAAHEYIATALPAEPSLWAYGAGFADFLASFPPCRDLAYLPDVARLERAIGAAFHAPHSNALPLSILASFGQDQASDLVFSLQLALGHLASDWPVDRIWLAHQDNRSTDALGALAPEAMRLEIYRADARPVFRRLTAGEFAFRRAVARGMRLEEATDAALSLDFLFDLPVALQDLFDEGLVVGCKSATDAKEV
jgi:hypothetical protein